jgi:AbrB family looped-hinge helix DNA binding protein
MFSPIMILKSFDEILLNLYFNKKSKEMKGLLSTKSQVTIPKKIRLFLGIHPGDAIDFKVVDGHVELVSVVTEKKGLAGVLKKYALREKHSGKEIGWKEKVAHGISSEGLSR